MIGLQQESIIGAIKTLEGNALQVVMRGDMVINPESLTSDRPTLKPVATPSVQESASPGNNREVEHVLADMLSE